MKVGMRRTFIYIVQVKEYFLDVHMKKLTKHNYALEVLTTEHYYHCPLTHSN